MGSEWMFLICPVFFLTPYLFLLFVKLNGLGVSSSPPGGYPFRKSGPNLFFYTGCLVIDSVFSNNIVIICLLIANAIYDKYGIGY